MSNNDQCPNCSADLKSGWGSNSLISQKSIDFINLILNKNEKGYCEKCSNNLIKESKKAMKERVETLKDYLEKNMKYIPILTTHTPFGWEYIAGSIVTGQSVTGTGVVSEFTSDITDFFGSQSGAFNKKLANGELMCFKQMRAKALKQNANAIIATDIDYGEAGAAKGMLMVCAAGTAIQVTNTEVFNESKRNVLNKLLETSNNLEKLLIYKDFLK